MNDRVFNIKSIFKSLEYRFSLEANKNIMKEV